MISYCRLRLAVLLWSDTGTLRPALSLTLPIKEHLHWGQFVVALSKREIRSMKEASLSFSGTVSACLSTLD